jgi:hypothetical protein
MLTSLHNPRTREVTSTGHAKFNEDLSVKVKLQVHVQNVPKPLSKESDMKALIVERKTQIQKTQLTQKRSQQAKHWM